MAGKSKWIRIAVIVCIAALLLLTAGFALADGGVVNPSLREVWQHERRANIQRAQYDSEDVPNAYSASQAITFTRVTAPTLGGIGKWNLSFDSQNCGTPISSYISLQMKDYSSSYTTVYKMEYDYLPSTVSTCTIVSGGEYQLYVFVQTTTSGSNGYANTVNFTIADDSSHTSLTEKVASVVSSCRAGTQWQTALNIHDWIVNNVYYDLNLQYYGADMILRGYGVCDSYSKAYCMLCKQAGISVYRVTNDDHAWNAVYLDGNWYFVDCTWDDPAGSTAAKSGSEGHDYFCLNTELLGLDHDKPWEWTGTSARSCTALDNNYYIRRGDWNGIGNRYYDYDANSWTSYSEAIANQIAGNRGGNYIDFQDFYYISDNWGYNVSYPLDTPLVRGWKLLAYAITSQPMSISGFGTVKLDVWFSESDKCFIYAVRGYNNLTDTGTLTLPTRMKTIEAEAFANIYASAVVIPDGCTSIGKNAFYGSNVHKVYVPDSVTSIDDAAFAGCSNLMIVCSGNTPISNFAYNHGILWHYP